MSYQHNKFDFLITNAEVIASAKPLSQFTRAMIGIEGDRISYVGPTLPPDQASGKTVFDAKGSLVIPGLVNVHTHTILTMVRGVAEDMGFAPAYTPGVPHGHDVLPHEAVALAKLGALEAMRFGSTLINDSYVHAEHTLPAMAELGLRVFTCGRIHDVDFSRVHWGEWKHNPKIGFKTIEEAIRLYDRWNGSFDGRTGVQFTPHAPDTCSKDLLREIAKYCQPLGIRVTTHLSQSRLENRRILERDSCTPTELLDDVGLLNSRLIAAHGIFMTDSDIKRAGSVGINLAHIPKGNATGGHMAPTRRMHRAGMALTLATDNMHGDLIEVMRWALCIGRVQEGCIDDEWQPADVLQMATMAGAQAMGLSAEIGTLEPGKKADLVVLNMDQPHWVPKISILGNLMHVGQGRDITHVMIDGRWVIEGGRATLVDEEKIKAEAQQAAESLWTRARTELGDAQASQSSRSDLLSSAAS